MSIPNLDKQEDEFHVNDSEILKLSTIVVMPSSQDNVSDSLNGEPDQWILDIDLRGKELAIMPPFFPKYQFCTYLNLSSNNLEGDIDWLIHLKRLKVLDVSHNKLTELADVCGSVSTLEQLNLSHNLLKELPEWILLLENVKNLDLSFNPLESTCHVHLKKAKWKSIEICHLEKVNLVSVPDCLLTAKHLRELYLGTNNFIKSFPYKSNVIWSVPELLPSSLSILDVNNVHLTNLEYDWKQLENLKEFRARGNVSIDLK